MKVLILDDDQALLDVCQLILEKDCTVLTHDSCNNVLELVESAKPDVILMDCWIPERGGVYATRLLKAVPQYRDIPVILFSATNNLEEQTEKAGADGYLKKPFNIKDLKKIIMEHYERAQAQRPLTGFKVMDC